MSGGTDPATGRFAAIHALGSRPPVRAILSAWAACFAGEAIAAVAFGVIAYKSAGATGVALLVAVQLLPTAVLAPVIVAMAERVRRERLAFAVDLARAAVAAVAAILSEASAPREALFALAAILTIGTAVSNPPRRGLLPLLVREPGGLLVEVTDGTTAYNASRYRISVFYDLAKVAVNRLAFSQGHELAPHGATAVAITPGWLRSEMMLEAFGVTAADWRDALGTAGRAPTAPPDFAHSESPRYVGRSIAALATDPDRGRWNGRSVDSGALARVYGFTDVDGTQPDIWPVVEAADPPAAP